MSPLLRYACTLLQADRYHPDGASDTNSVLAAFQRGEAHGVYGDFGMQSLQQRASRNPVAITEHFHRRTLCAWDKLLGVSMSQRKTCPFNARQKGALGRLAAMQYVTECNGRKSLHIHALTYGSLLGGAAGQPLVAPDASASTTATPATPATPPSTPTPLAPSLV